MSTADLLGTLAPSRRRTTATVPPQPAGTAPREERPATDPLTSTTATASRLNWLRAAVLGANDGIVSVAGVVVAVAGATTASGPLLTAGVAALLAGAVSMALGEYVSVNSQRDAQRTQLGRLRRALGADHRSEVEHLAAAYRAKGLSNETAHRVAVELTEADPVTAHAEARLGLDPDELANAWHAAWASAAAFTLGGLLPLLAILLPAPSARVPVAFVAVLSALALTGAVSARLGEAPVGRAVLRVVVGGALGLGVTYAVGWLFGVAVG
ncbi:VIT1/CCC1 transporter family protein [Thalassiella azotivora]